ncbi:hypothetical protein RND81_02G028000 [Saponaria officinalis]|uniref:Knottins-like domain-containing protein n=1 Tax=Saponaria officinalis TaxID=3572 RepID=A0AAW1MR82_SAPOF
MKHQVKPFAAIFIMLLLTLASEARMCKRPSQKFRGLCTRDTNCVSVCATEGYANGDCHGLRRRCICSKPCP